MTNKQTPEQTSKMINDALGKAFLEGGVEAYINVLPILEGLKEIVDANIASIKDFIETNKDQTVASVTADLPPPANVGTTG